MPVPNSFANVTTSIPLSQLDANFNTPITLGNTAIQLGNTVTTLNNMTLANVNISSGIVTITNASVTTANVTNLITGNAAITGGAINGTTLGATTASTANVTTLTTSSTVTINGGTANQVQYLDGSKALVGSANLTFNGTTLSAAGLSDSGNLTFTGTGNRIRGDFSNATLNNSVAFQTSTVNGDTRVSFIPNGTNDSSSLLVHNTATPDNSHYGRFRISSTTVFLESAFAGNPPNSFLPMAFNVGGSEAMRIDTSGNVGIGTSSPASRLHIQGSTDCVLTNTAQSGSSWFAGTNTAAYILHNASNTPMVFTTNGTERARISAAGELLVGSATDQGAYNIQCNGTGVWGAAAYVNGSDERIKEDIAPITSGLDVVTQMNPVTYRYKESWSKDQSVQTGFIAQELLVAMEGKNYVEGVVQQGGSEGYYSVAYQNIIPLLTKAIQELKAELDATKAEIAALKGAA